MFQTQGTTIRRRKVRAALVAVFGLALAGCALLGASGPTSSAVWRLDPAHPAPGPETTELRLLIMETECASGTDPRNRIGTPEIDHGSTSLTITIPIRRMSDATCQGNGEYPYLLSLGEPLGDRELLGGGSDGQPLVIEATPTPAS